MGFSLSLILSVVSRLIPHPANFTPIGSLILFNSRKSFLRGVALGLLAMIISDIFLGFSFSSIFVYAGFVAYALFGRIKKLHPLISVVFGSMAFFVISNFGVWLGPWYSHDWSGLVLCFTRALPFYRNTILSDAGFVIVILAMQRIYIKLPDKYKNMMTVKLKPESELKKEWYGKRA